MQLSNSSDCLHQMNSHSRLFNYSFLTIYNNDYSLTYCHHAVIKAPYLGIYFCDCHIFSTDCKLFRSEKRSFALLHLGVPHPWMEIGAELIM